MVRPNRLHNPLMQKKSVSNRKKRAPTAFHKFPNAWTARRTLSFHMERLLKHPAVHHCSVMVKFDAVKGNRIPLIRVHTTDWKLTDQMSGLPKRLKALDNDGRPLNFYIPVELAPISGKPQLFGYSGGDQVIGKPNLEGICAFTFEQGNEGFFVTNTHIVAEPDENPIGNSTWYFEDYLGAVEYGEVISTTKINHMDAVVVKFSHVDYYPTMSVNRETLRIVDKRGIYSSKKGPYFYISNNKIVKCYYPEYVPGPFTVEFRGEKIKFEKFWKLKASIDSEKSPSRGDSGAILYSRSNTGLIARGLVFGGNEHLKEVWAFSATQVWRDLFD